MKKFRRLIELPQRKSMCYMVVGVDFVINTSWDKKVSWHFSVNRSGRPERSRRGTNGYPRQTSTPLTFGPNI